MKIDTAILDEDGYAHINGVWISPEDVVSINDGSFESVVVDTLEEMAKKNNLSGLNTYSEYVDGVCDAIGLESCANTIRSRAAKEHSALKNYKSVFSLGN